jgi:hypothetical protein
MDYEDLEGPFIDEGFDQRLLSLITDSEQSDKQSKFIAEALQVLREVHPPTCEPVESPTSIVTGDDALLADTAKELKDAENELYRIPPTPPKDYSLHIEYRPSGALEARVEWVRYDPPASADLSTIRRMNDALRAGGRPPYVRMANDRQGRLQAPTEDQTIRLFGLCEEQAFAFRILAHTLRQEIAAYTPGEGGADDPNPPFLPSTSTADTFGTQPRQLLMVLLGGAGDWLQPIHRATDLLAYLPHLSAPPCRPTACCPAVLLVSCLVHLFAYCPPGLST